MKRPWPVTLLAILAGLGALLGVLNLSSASHALLPSQKALVIGLRVVGIVINGLTAYGLWGLRNWARLMVIVLTAISMAGIAAAILVPIVTTRNLKFAPAPIAWGILGALALEGLIIAYLCKNSTKAVFTDRVQ